MIKKKYDYKKEFEKRLALLSFTAVAVFGVLVLRLWFMQVVYGDYYRELAEQNRLKIEKKAALRGEIYDASGNLLASNRLSYAVFVDKEVLNDEEAFVRLAEVLETSAGALQQKAKSGSLRVENSFLVATDIPFEKVAYIQERKEEFRQFDISYLPVRNYPEKDFAAHVLGYVGEISEKELECGSFPGAEQGDIVGKTGIERAYDNFLRGTKGETVLEVDALGNVRRTIKEELPVPGSSVYLTIRAEIQRAAEEALVKAIKLAHRQKYRAANAAAAVVLEVNTGRVVALASYPDYDPNLFIGGIAPDVWKQLTSAKNNYPLLNRVTQAAYPPGSTFKPVTLVSALEQRLTYSSEMFTCVGKWTGFGPEWPKYCWKRSGHGTIGLIAAITESCDSVFYDLGYRLYKAKGEPLQDTARKFGFGKSTGIVIGDIAGRVPDTEWKKKHFKKKEQQIWLPGDTVNLAIGQGDMLATPLQIAQFYAAVANGGKIYRPQLVEKIVSPTGIEVESFTPEITDTYDFNRATLNILKTGLKRVVESGTAAGAFKGFPVKVAGKTGTSQVYGKDDYSLFVAYAPADEPRYVVCVVVEQGGHGGSVAAPAARYILSYLFGIDEKELVYSEDVSR